MMQVIDIAELNAALIRAVEYEIILPEQQEELVVMLKGVLEEPRYTVFGGWTVENYRDCADNRYLHHLDLSDKEIKDIMDDEFDGKYDIEDAQQFLDNAVINHCYGYDPRKKR